MQPEGLLLGTAIAGAATELLWGYVLEARRIARGARTRRPAPGAHPGPPPADRASWWAWYSAYLASVDWARRRRAVLQRAGGRCELCRRRRAHHIHHLTYARVGREPLSDLQALCQPCHESVHGRKL